MKRRIPVGLLVGAAVVLLLLLLSPRVRELFSGSAGPDVSARDPRLPVEAVVVRPQAVTDRIYATGTILSNEEVEVRSEISGKIVQILFREGSRVAKDDLLLKIDDSELQAQALKVDSQLKLAQDKEARRRQLFDKGNISPEDYDVALNELNAIRAEAQLIQARIQKTEVRAPFSGVIGLRYVSEGSFVSSSTRIANLQSISQVKVDFSVPERYAGEVKRGQTIRFRIAGSDDTFSGSIYAIEPKIDPSTRTVLIRAVCPNPEGRISPGGFAQVELSLRELADAMMIPTQALVPDLLGQKVYVVRDGVAREQRVEIGLRTDSTVQIASGLAAMDTVITSGILQLAPGMSVRLTDVR